ncbi:DUF2062 domain-containing protein [Pseudomaricurvus alkylphenolicus]|uniref:DUF2062 domain-containing protein n=1 Tax=Pseudomaricurvus alkylphenolicus TaxID=1306991 RepID=UPI00141D8FE2|nr:DUF2062 domain-containing protein [Pseudomaricurvus alkylphenolicus]NIB41261.1 DUF2062 domain-containing protein [Pseudomaricurvus alkylphenolicus]
MARKILKRWLPNPHEIKEHPTLNFMSHLLHDPNLFHLNRHSVSGAFFVGLFVALMPTLGQMPIAALVALMFRVNMPIAVALVWISNPLTMPAIFYATYEFGRWILDSPALEFTMELSWEWFSTEFTKLWQPLVVGSLLAGLVVGCLGYISMQLFWRWHVVRNWEKRKARRQAQESSEDI